MTTHSKVIGGNGRFVQTHSGAIFNFDDLEGSEVRIDDIAHALSQICRFGGQTSRFYSVAEHSIHASNIVDPAHAREALLHDAHEAFIGDETSPVKACLPCYEEFERPVRTRVRAALGLPPTLHPSVKAADMAMLKTESNLVGGQVRPWSALEGVEAARVNIFGWEPAMARRNFLARYWMLTPHEQRDRSMIEKRTQYRARYNVNKWFGTREAAVRYDIDWIYQSSPSNAKQALRKILTQEETRDVWVINGSEFRYTRYADAVRGAILLLSPGELVERRAEVIELLNSLED